MEWLQQSNPDYAAIGVKLLMPQELADPAMYWHKNTSDLVYRGFNVKIFKAFLSVMKKKDNNGKLILKEHIRKFVDAVKWGSATVKQNLPKVFYTETDAYLAAYKKEFAGAKKKGLTDKTTANPMCSPKQCICLGLDGSAVELHGEVHQY